MVGAGQIRRQLLPAHGLPQFAQAQDEGAQALALTKRVEDFDGAHEFLLGEGIHLLGTGLGLGCQLDGAPGRQPGSRQLPVVGRGIARRRAIPEIGQFHLAGFFRGAGRPIRAAGPAYGICDRSEHGLEVEESRGVFVEKPQHDPAGQPFRLGERRPLFQPMLLDQAVGLRDMSLAERAARQDRPLAPPYFGMRGVGRRPVDQFRRRIQALAPAPAQALVDEAGVVLERGGQPLDCAVDVSFHAHEHEAGFGQGAPIRIDFPQHAARRPVAAPP